MIITSIYDNTHGSVPSRDTPKEILDAFVKSSRNLVR